MRIIYDYYLRELVTCKKTYAGDALQVEEKFDYDRNNMLSFYQRSDGHRTRIKKIKARTEEPGLGLPEVIEEYGLDQGKERLIRREHLTYSPRYDVVEKQVYDDTGALRYTLYWEYDPMGRVTRTVDAEGQEIKYTYDCDGRLSTKVTPTSTTKITYDAAGRPIETKASDSHRYVQCEHTYYDGQGLPVVEIDAAGNTTQFTRDSGGNSTKTTHPPTQIDGKWVYGVHERTYDAWGNITSKKDEEGNLTHYTYNGRNQPIRIVYPDGTNESYIYLLNGELRAHTDTAGLVTTYTRDYQNRPIVIEVQNSSGEVLKETRYVYEGDCLLALYHPDGTVTRYTYDFLGQLIEEDHEGQKTLYEYEPLGRLAKKTLECDSGTTVYRYAHDLLDRIIREEVCDHWGQLLQWKSWEYDFEGRKTLISDGSAETRTQYSLYGPISVVDPNGDETVTTYTHEWFRTPAFSRTYQFLNAIGGKKVLTIDPLGNRTIVLHTPRGQILSTERQDSKRTLLARSEMEYNRVNRLFSEHHAAICDGKPLRTYTLRHSYDVMGRPLSLSEEGEGKNRSTYFSYDALGRLQTTTRPSGQILCRTYDSLGRLATHSGPDFSDFYQYDLADRLLSITSQDGTTTSRSYDTRGYLISETLATGHTVTYERDLQGRATEITLPDRSTFEYTFTGPWVKNVGRQGHTFSYKYNEGGRIIEINSPAEKTTLSYDRAHRPLSLASPSFTQALTYDAVGNITFESVSDPHTSYIQDYTHDNLYQLTSEQGRACHTYASDSLHNRLEADRDSYTYDGLNQLLSSGSISFAYDEDGQTVSEGKWRYDYDSQGRLIWAFKGDLEIAYTYDPLHRRLSKEVTRNGASIPNAYREYLYLETEEIGSLDNTHRLAEFRLPGPKLSNPNPSTPLLELDGVTYFSIQDYRGSLAVLLNLKGQSQEVYHYSAFGAGEVISQGGFTHEASQVGNPYQFLSKRSDAETGHTFFGRRYYRPTLGRWLTPDPKGFDDGPNLYAYCHHRPLTEIDLYGLSAWSTTCTTYRGVNDAFTESVMNFVPNMIGGIDTACRFAWDCAFHPIDTTHHVRQSFAAANTTLAQGSWGDRVGVFFPRTGGLVNDWSQLSGDERGYRIGQLAGSPTGTFAASMMTAGAAGVASSMTISPTRAFASQRLAPARLGSSTLRTPTKYPVGFLEHPQPKPLDLSRTGGKIWSATKERTSVQNAYAHWKQHGYQYPQFLNSRQYVEGTHNFLSAPPPGNWSKTRLNGDQVFYDPFRNNYGVLNKDGVPKTMFKPRDGFRYF